ncbi:MAG: type II toxin-antitoxin system RelE family toxin [Thermoplasmatota archaeon]
MFQVLLSRTFQKQFRDLPLEMQNRIRKNLKELEKDPRTSRSGADIRQLKDTDPSKHRLRIGEYRIIYRIEDRSVLVIELFTRSRGYRE